REQILTAGFDGIVLHQSRGKGEKLRWENTRLAKGHEEPAPKAGTSDVALGHLHKRRFLAAVEAWHGNEVVVYTEDAAHKWQRRVIFNGLVEGHEVALGDFDGDGRDDIVAGDRGKGASVHVFFAQDDTGAGWRHQVIDEGGMAGSGCTTADINGDGQVDVICIGASTANIKWYENLGAKR
ncbi:MAG: VCBS repeat-containing protein, partial [Acidobacteria bacterium]|nr:VCBS repeat-containing protein [Acidobacteriota bacterium]